jgi:hypothetical protein
MRTVTLFILATAVLGGGCSSPSSDTTGTTAGVVRCSSQGGPVAGPAPNDAGMVTECEPGGQCLLVGGNPGSGACALLDGGCQVDPATKYWMCVYERGSSGEAGAKP